MYTILTFKCSKCGSYLNEEIPVPDNNMSGDEEIETMDIVSCHVCEVDYHVHLINNGGVALATINGIDNDDVDASYPYVESRDEMPDELEWYSSYAFQSSYDYFISSINDMKKILTYSCGDYNQKEILKRMVFVQSISAMESYLADTLISRVIVDKDLLARLYEVDNILNKEKCLFFSFLKDPNKPKKKAQEYLSSLIYHNIQKIEKLYNKVLCVKFEFETIEERQRLLKAIDNRHDCVHRNGKNIKGDLLLVLSDKYVNSTIDLIETFVRKLQLQFDECDEIPF